jgi:hypothetical protein
MNEVNEGQLNRLVICPECCGEGVVDSGGQTPWGSWINVPCPLCGGKPITEREVREAGWSPAENAPGERRVSRPLDPIVGNSDKEDMKFRKKPVIEAVIWDETKTTLTRLELMGMVAMRHEGHVERPDECTGLGIRTLEGTMRVSLGDWIIRGVDGEFCARKPGIFAATYESVDDMPRRVRQAGNVVMGDMAGGDIIPQYMADESETPNGESEVSE